MNGKRRLAPENDDYQKVISNLKLKLKLETMIWKLLQK